MEIKKKFKGKIICSIHSLVVQAHQVLLVRKEQEDLIHQQNSKMPANTN